MKPDVLVHHLNKLKLHPGETYLRDGLKAITQLLMELDVSAFIDAEHYERSDNRVAYRNGYRNRKWKTSLGRLSLRIPKLRKGTYYPAFIDRDQHAQHLLVDLLKLAYLNILNFDDIQSTLDRIDLGHLRPYEVAQINDLLHDLAMTARQTPLSNTYQDLWLDVIKLDQPYRNIRVIFVAMGMNTSGDVQALDFEICTDDDDELQWTAFLKRLIARGLVDVQYVVSGDQGGLRTLIHDLFDAEWAYRRPYELQEVLYYISENNQYTLVDAVSNLFLEVPYAVNQPNSLYILDFEQPVSVLSDVA